MPIVPVPGHDFSCHTIPVHKIEPQDDSASTHMFSIEVVATFSPPVDFGDGEESTIEALNGGTVVLKNTFPVERHLLLNHYTSASSVRIILNEMKVPIQSFMVEQILDCAHRMAQEDYNLGRKVLRMKVDIEIPPMYLMTSDDEDEGEDVDYPPVRMVRASGSAIERLEAVEVKKSGKMCPVCLEELEAGEKESWLPCFHVYHYFCIWNWMQKSNVCPLCRLQI